jgi:hypothetical protein
MQSPKFKPHIPQKKKQKKTKHPVPQKRVTPRFGVWHTENVDEPMI